jgi:hypothetical protein
MNGIKETKGFSTSDGKFHTSKLQALVAEQKIALRGIIQSDVKYSGRQNFTSTDVADAIERNVEQIKKVTTYFKTAINRARVHEKPVAPAGATD